MDKTYVIGGVRQSERSVRVEVITPSGEVKKLRLTPKMWERYALSSGDVVTQGVFSALSADSEKCEAVTKALACLSDAPHSYRALENKLKRAGYSADAIEAAILLVKKRALIDEEAQAVLIAEKMARGKNRGPSRVRAELMNKGYPSDVAHRAVMAVPEELYDEALRKLVRGKCRGGIPSDKNATDKLVASIVRSGFSASKAMKMIGELSEE